MTTNEINKISELFANLLILEDQIKRVRLISMTTENKEFWGMMRAQVSDMNTEIKEKFNKVLYQRKIY